jgi:hypothetical protein
VVGQVNQGDDEAALIREADVTGRTKHVTCYK